MSRSEASAPVMGLRAPADVGARTVIQVIQLAAEETGPIAPVSLDAPAPGRFLLDGLGRVSHLDAAAAALAGLSVADALGRPIEQVVAVAGLAQRVRRVIDGSAAALERDDAMLAARGDSPARRLVERIEPIASIDRTPVGAVLTLEDAAATALVAARRRALLAIDRADAAETLEQVLRALLDAIVPGVADVAVARVLDTDGSVGARASRSPEQDALLRAVEPLLGVAAADEPPLGRAVMRLEGTQLLKPSPEGIAALFRDTRLADAARDLALRAVLVLPLRSRFGAGVLAIGAVDRTFGPDDQALAEALARRAVLLLERLAARQRLSKAVQTRERLLSRMSHDLINPAAAISMAADILVARMQPGDVNANQLRMIQRAANQLNGLIQNVNEESASEAQKAR